MQHEIHRFDVFLPALMRRHSELMDFVPEERRPEPQEDLRAWVRGLPQELRMELCQLFVLQTLRKLRVDSPLTNVLLRGCLFLEGEFDLHDTAVLGIGAPLPPGDPRREEVRRALLVAVDAGILIHTPGNDRFCIPFPVQFSLEGFDLLDPIERDALRLRIVQNFAAVAMVMTDDGEEITPAHWRFSNLMLGFEIAAALFEESQGLGDSDWMEACHELDGVPESLSEPLLQYGRALGKAIVRRRSEHGEKPIAAAVCAAVTVGDSAALAQFEETLAQFHLRRGHFARAAGVYERIEAHRRANDDARGVVLAITARAIAMRDAGDGETALQVFLRANREAAALDLVDEYLDTANCAGELLLAEDDPKGVLRLAASLEVSGEGNRRRQLAMAEFRLLVGRACARLGAFDEALDEYESVLLIAAEHGHRPLEAAAHREQGKLLMEHGERVLAWKAFSRGLALFEEVSDFTGACGCALEMLNQYSTDCPLTREDLLRRAVDAALESPDQSNAIEALQQWAAWCRQTGDDQGALVAYQKLVAMLRLLADHERRALVHLESAETNLALEYHDEALREALSAQALYRHVESPIPPRVEDIIRLCSEKIGPDFSEFVIERLSQDWESGDFLSPGGNAD